MKTIAQPGGWGGGHVTVQVAARLDSVRLPNSTVTQRFRETAGGPVKSCRGGGGAVVQPEAAKLALLPRHLTS